METLKELPIFCDNCPTLAFARVDDAPLCEACLMAAIKQNASLKIEPLQFKDPQIYKCFGTNCQEMTTP